MLRKCSRAARRLHIVPTGSLYHPSPRPFPERLPPLDYPGRFLVKRVTHAGTFRLKQKLLFIANALKEHHIGLDETDDAIWSIYFGRVLLAKVDERDMIIRDTPFIPPPQCYPSTQ